MKQAPFERPAFLPELHHLGALRGEQVALTGHRGVLGGLLAERLQAGGVSVATFAGDINDADALLDWCSTLRCRHLFHFAACVPVTQVEADPLQAYQTNVIGTFNLCRAMIKTRPDCWFFQCSTSHVYQPTSQPESLTENAATVPATYYGVTKLAAERLVSDLLGKLGRPWCAGRVFSYSHARQQPPYLVPSLRERIAALDDGATLSVRNPSSVRDILDARDVVDAILQLALSRATGIINIGSGTGWTVRELAEAIARQSGRRIIVVGEDLDPPAALIADTTLLRRHLAGLHT
jgi:UDP-glucose 4-epimerase/GDP-4-dehydro-6-deoxy-D-mannose reductase